MVTEKKCSSCKKILPASDFGMLHGKLRYSCRKCNYQTSNASRKNPNKKKYQKDAKPEYPIWAFKIQIENLLRDLGKDNLCKRARINTKPYYPKQPLPDKHIEFWLFVDTEDNRGLLILIDKKFYPVSLEPSAICHFLTKRNILFHTRLKCNFSIWPELKGGRSFREFGLMVLTRGRTSPA